MGGREGEKSRVQEREAATGGDLLSPPRGVPVVLKRVGSPKAVQVLLQPGVAFQEEQRKGDSVLRGAERVGPEEQAGEEGHPIADFLSVGPAAVGLPVRVDECPFLSNQVNSIG